ncbi:MAG: hypothetical protein ACK4IY_07515, partial [Chitinophagales bacterium]
MKKFLLPAMILGLIITITSCTNNNPEKTVSDFLDAINERNWEEAKKLSTTDSESMIDMLKGFSEMVPDSAITKIKYEILKEKTTINGDNASVFSRDENGNEMEYKVVKVDNVWKVNFSIEAVMGDMQTEQTIDQAL